MLGHLCVVCPCQYCGITWRITLWWPDTANQWWKCCWMGYRQSHEGSEKCASSPHCFGCERQVCVQEWNFVTFFWIAAWFPWKWSPSSFLSCWSLCKSLCFHSCLLFVYLESWRLKCCFVLTGVYLRDIFFSSDLSIFIKIIQLFNQLNRLLNVHSCYSCRFTNKVAQNANLAREIGSLATACNKLELVETWLKFSEHGMSSVFSCWLTEVHPILIVS